MAVAPGEHQVERLAAIAGADQTCPRCGARRSADQRYCLDCGLLLPVVSGTLPALRRRWLRRFGWYPGDFVWAALLALLVTVAPPPPRLSSATAARRTGRARLRPRRRRSR